ncbi:MAG: excinuclease ABC subunit UvrC [Acidobacteria bacterium]|nr:excinuclease ABC subunit UvrC [Acidobacteriota bacterium]
MLQQKIELLPPDPGVYIFRNLLGAILYVGKARSLRQRVRSYFQAGRPIDSKTQRLVEEISDLEYIVTDNEVEALILESNLVKKNQPRYNIHLKDDKSFPYLKLTIQESYPRIFITRRIKKDGALYFGPFLPAAYARRTLKLVHKYFKLRTCSLEVDGSLERPCLDYQMKRCLGPCVSGLCTKENYDRAVEDVRLLLSGKTDSLIRRLEVRMNEASESMRYEAAAVYRDWITMVRDISERQKMALEGQDDCDLFGYFQEGTQLALEVFAMRGGRMVGRRSFFWEDLVSFDPGEFFSQALEQYYLQDTFTPKEIYIPADIEDAEVLEEWLSTRKGDRVHVRSPKRGLKSDMLNLVMRNAHISFDTRFRIIKVKGEALLKPLQEALGIGVLPRRIETFDVSHVQGTDTVASMVLCVNGEMKPSGYRKFRIEKIKSPDDFAAMREVIHRHYENVLEQEDGSLPDLVLIDGGKGQLTAAVSALDELGLENQRVAAIAKKEELIFVKGMQNRGIALPKDSPVLHLVQRMRDEAHRFAVTYHRKRRELRDFDSELMNVPGIGETRKKVLLRAFGSFNRVKAASFEELAPYVGPKAASSIIEHFRTAASENTGE